MRSEILILEVTKALTFYSEKDDNILLTGDFHMTPESYDLKDFTDSNNFENVIKEPTCFKRTSSTTIDLFLTNRKGCFLKSSANETGLSDHHKLMYIFLKSTYAKGKAKVVYYRCFKKFNKELFKKNLSENHKNIGYSFEMLHDTFTNT